MKGKGRIQCPRAGRTEGCSKLFAPTQKVALINQVCHDNKIFTTIFVAISKFATNYS